jgi:hypothetical protein
MTAAADTAARAFRSMRVSNAWHWAHLGDMRAEGTEVNVNAESEPVRHVTIRTRDAARRTTDQITTDEVIKLLDQLEPWLKLQFDRILHDT